MSKEERQLFAQGSLVYAKGSPNVIGQVYLQGSGGAEEAFRLARLFALSQELAECIEDLAEVLRSGEAISPGSDLASAILSFDRILAPEAPLQAPVDPPEPRIDPFDLPGSDE